MALAAIIFSFNFANASAENDTKFTYYTRVAAVGKSCAEEATLLASRFKQQSKVENVTAACAAESTIEDKKIKYPIYSLTLTYFSKLQSPLHTVKISAADSFNRPNGADGLFTRYTECLAAIPEQSAAYEAKTNLKVLNASCERGSYSGSKKFVIAIDGVGTSKINLYGIKLSPYFKYDNTLRAKFRSMLAKSGVEVVLEKNASLLYYSEWPASFQTQLLGGFNPPQLCLDQIEQIKVALKQNGNESAEVSCLPFKNTESESLNLVLFQTDYYPISEAYVANPISYYSFKECADDKARVFDSIKVATGKGPLFGLCDTDRDKFRLRVFQH